VLLTIPDSIPPYKNRFGELPKLWFSAAENNLDKEKRDELYKITSHSTKKIKAGDQKAELIRKTKNRCNEFLNTFNELYATRKNIFLDWVIAHSTIDSKHAYKGACVPLYEIFQLIVNFRNKPEALNAAQKYEELPNLRHPSLLSIRDAYLNLNRRMDIFPPGTEVEMSKLPHYWFNAAEYNFNTQNRIDLCNTTIRSIERISSERDDNELIQKTKINCRNFLKTFNELYIGKKDVLIHWLASHSTMDVDGNVNSTADCLCKLFKLIVSILKKPEALDRSHKYEESSTLALPSLIPIREAYFTLQDKIQELRTPIPGPVLDVLLKEQIFTEEPDLKFISSLSTISQPYYKQTLNEIVSLINRGTITLKKLNLKTIQAFFDYLGEESSQQIIRLNLEGCYPRISEEDIKFLAVKFPNLRVLSLKCCGVNDHMTSSLSQLKNLVSLDISFNLNITNIDFVSNFKELIHLNLEKCDSVSSLDSLKNCNLKTLNLAGCSKINIHELEHLRYRDTLTDLNVSSCDFNNLKFLKLFPNLTTLNLTGCNKIVDFSEIENSEIKQLIIGWFMQKNREELRKIAEKKGIKLS
jgi:hypothetical protein